MAMYKYYCPECGREGTGENGENLFRITLRGVFKAGTETENVHPEYLFLHKDVQMSDNLDDYKGDAKLIGTAWRAYQEQQGLVEDTSGERRSQPEPSDDEILYMFQNDTDDESEEHDEPDIDVYASAGRGSVPGGGEQNQGDTQEYMKYLRAANLDELRIHAGYSMDISQPFSEECRRYVWTVLFTKKLAELLNNDNQILDYLLSADLTGAEDMEEMEWCNRDLRNEITLEKNDSVYRQIDAIADSKTKNNLIPWMNDVKQLIAMLECTAKAQIHSCSPTSSFLTASVMEVENQKYLNSLRIGQRQVFRRICPHCGAHISKYLGMYPQKIISFIGKPSSGKSNIIVAMLALLSGDGNDKIPGLQCGFDLDDPQYGHYMNVLNLHKKKIAAPKTENDVFPVLTIKLSFNNRVMLYTFLDCPGELFDAQNNVEANQLANMSHLGAMAHSDAVCVVVSGEQLIKQDENEEQEHSRTEYDENPDRFLARIEMFRNSVLNNSNPPIFFIISKPDVLKKNRYVTDEENNIRYWFQSANDPDRRIEQQQVEDLFSWLEYQTNRFYWMVSESTDAREIPPGVINMAGLHTIQYRAQDFIAAIEDTNNLLERLYGTICKGEIYENKTWRIVPLFMISPFGFYAVKGIWQVSRALKLKMIDNWTTLRVTPKERDELANGGSISDVEAVLKEDAEENMMVLASCGVTGKEFEQRLEECYIETNSRHSRYGANQFLLWLLVYTGLIGAVYQAHDAMAPVELTNKAYAIGKFFMENSGVFRILQNESVWTILYQKLEKICDAAAKRNAIVKSGKIEKLGQEITQLDSQLKMVGWLNFPEKRRLSTQITQTMEEKQYLESKRDNLNGEIRKEMDTLNPYFRQLFRLECNLSDFVSAMMCILPDVN